MHRLVNTEHKARLNKFKYLIGKMVLVNKHHVLLHLLLRLHLLQLQLQLQLALPLFLRKQEPLPRALHSLQKLNEERVLFK